MRKHTPLKSRSLLFAAYLAVLCFGIFYHEPFPPEAQAWLLARDTGPLDLLLHHMRYEANPGLWHLMLMVPAKFGAPLVASNLLSGAFAAATAALLLFCSPFPLWLSGPLLFTFFLGYQYAVIARPYVLSGLCLFLLAKFFPERHRRPGSFFALLGLLTLSSVHGGLLAVVLAGFYLWEGRKNADRRVSFLAVAYLLLLALVAAELWPPADYDPRFANSDYANFNFSPRHLLQVAFLSVNGALTRNVFLSAASLLALFVFYAKAGRLALVTALLAVILLFFGVKGFRGWHLGFLHFILVFGAWISWQGVRPARNLAGALMLLAVAPSLAMNVWWTVNSLRYERTHLFDGGREMARYLREQGAEQKRIYAYGPLSLSLQPYFTRNIFANLRSAPTFNPWRKGSAIYENLPDPIPPEAELLLLAFPHYGMVPDPFVEFPQLARDGWRLQKSLQIPWFWKDGNGSGFVGVFHVFSKADLPPERYAITATLDVPPKLRSFIHDGEGSLHLQLWDGRVRRGPGYYSSPTLENPTFPLRVEITSEQINSFLRTPDGAQKVREAPVSFRVFFCPRGSHCGPNDAFGYIRQKLTWNPGPNLGTLRFQGFNPAKRDCESDVLVAGTIRLHPSARTTFPGSHFLFAVVGQITDGNWGHTRYELLYSHPVELGETASFRVARNQVKLPPNLNGHFLLYLLDPKGCVAEDPASCAKKLIDNRDADMSHVIPLTTETLVTPYCGQTGLRMWGFREPEWETIPIPPDLLR